MSPTAGGGSEEPSASLLTAHEQVRAVTRARAALIGLVTFNLFANHWSRDSVGALEIPLEDDTFGLSVREYNSLSAAYFAPSVPVPIAAGIFSQLFGPANTLLLFSCFAFAGNVCMMAGSRAASELRRRYPLLLVGRLVRATPHSQPPSGSAFQACPRHPPPVHGHRIRGRRHGYLLTYLLTYLLSSWASHTRPSTWCRSACWHLALRSAGRCWWG